MVWYTIEKKISPARTSTLEHMAVNRIKAILFFFFILLTPFSAGSTSLCVWYSKMSERIFLHKPNDSKGTNEMERKNDWDYEFAMVQQNCINERKFFRNGAQINKYPHSNHSHNQTYDCGCVAIIILSKIKSYFCHRYRYVRLSLHGLASVTICVTEVLFVCWILTFFSIIGRHS